MAASAYWVSSARAYRKSIPKPVVLSRPEKPSLYASVTSNQIAYATTRYFLTIFCSCTCRRTLCQYLWMELLGMPVRLAMSLQVRPEARSQISFRSSTSNGVNQRIHSINRSSCSTEGLTDSTSRSARRSCSRWSKIISGQPDPCPNWIPDDRRRAVSQASR